MQVHGDCKLKVTVFMLVVILETKLHLYSKFCRKKKKKKRKQRKKG